MIYDPDVVIEYFKLVGRSGNKPQVKKGVQLTACCPFPHYKPDRGQYFERNPSFGINLETGQFNCYSCGKAGKTLDQLAWKLDLDLPTFTRTAEVQESRDNDSYESINDFDASFLAINQNEADEYLVSRGIVGVTHQYGIGRSSDGVSVYIPIKDRKGNFVAWTEKNLQVNEWYMKPDGVEKKGLLFGAHEKLQSHGYVVESTIDKLKLSSWGYSSVATCSANVTSQQIEMIADLFSAVTLIPHNDGAGDSWVARLIDGLVNKILVYALKLPANYKDVGEIDKKETFETLLPRVRMIKGTMKDYGISRKTTLPRDNQTPPTK